MNIHVNLDDKNYPVSTYGGYSKELGLDIDSYGIQINDFSLTLTSKTAIELVKELKKHLEINGFKI